jgi:transposase
MGVGGRGAVYPGFAKNPTEDAAMSEMFNPRSPATAFDHATTIVAVSELSGKSWLFGAIAPGVNKRVKRSFAARDIASVTKALEQLKAQAEKAGLAVTRTVLAYEAGRDGFWIARALNSRGVDVHVMHPASIPIERRGKRAKTDRIDVDLLLTTLIGWLRGEPGRCTMAPIPTQEEEDMREPGRRRNALVQDRLRIENRIGGLLIRYGIAGFNPRLKSAEKKLAELKAQDGSLFGAPLPPETMNSLKLLLAQHRLLSQQLKEIEEAREKVVEIEQPDRLQRMIQVLASPVGVGVETATVLVHEVLSRHFKDRRALGGFVGLTGTPYDSGGSKTEQGISKNGNPQVRRMLSQLAWRWLRHQPASALTQWFHARLNGAKGRMKKVLIVALTRKLLVALWRYVETGEVPNGARLAAAKPA